jgi:Plasmid pRiA4b ORF-3-like protein
MVETKKQRPVSTTTARIYHLRVSLEGTEPLIWRRLQVPGSASLGWLHAVIQVAMGWTNSHLHQFVAGKRLYSDPSFELDEFEDDPRVLEEEKTVIHEIAPRAKSVFVYQYDFGDSWDHRITVEKILEADPAEGEFAQCLDGDRACPPEDCGGVWGYEDLLKIIRNPKHKEYESMMEWLGGKFNPEAFDRDNVNKYLRKLKWARTTVG